MSDRVKPSRYEGFWRSSENADDDLPWPEPNITWAERMVFLEMLDRAEAEAETIEYRGFSLCRLCRCKNGFQSFRLDAWEWPSGFRHYVSEHGVRPTEEFVRFVLEWQKV